jgi:hypothetical protein
VLTAWSVTIAEASDWRLNEPAPIPSDEHRKVIGQSVCGESGFELSAEGLRCKICPKFTSNPGSKEGLHIVHTNRSRFSSAAAENEWLLDTEGCEAHYASFGGAILLSHTTSKTVFTMPAVELGFSIVVNPAAGPLALAFYKPGFRVNDCLPWIGKDDRNLLVCNEADMAQGEIIGHISSMEISRRGITRWRLLCWYDNTSSDLSQVVSVLPSEMRRIEEEGGTPGLQLKLKIFESTREVYEKGSEPTAKQFSLLFKRKGQRFFRHQEEPGTVEGDQ